MVKGGCAWASALYGLSPLPSQPALLDLGGKNQGLVLSLAWASLLKEVPFDFSIFISGLFS